MAVVPTICERLQNADMAYDRLMRGEQASSFRDENGENVTYTMLSADALLSYIRRLQPLCPTYQAAALGVQATTPLRFIF